MRHFTLVLAVCGLLVSTLAYAQVPQTISYQGLLTTSSGAPIADGNYNLTFSLYTVPTGGTAIWAETHSSVPVSKGTFSVILGSTTPLTGVDFAQQLYLGITKDSDPEFSPRSALTSTPSSLAPWAISGTDITYTGGNVGIGTTSPTTKLHVGGTPGTDGIRFPDGTLQTTAATAAWNLSGNAGTTAGTNFVGTTDAQALDIRTNNTLRTRITTKGQIETYNTGQSVFVGEGAGANDDLTTNRNVFVGHQAGFSNITGFWNTANGYQALYSNTTGGTNTANGVYALSSNNTGYQNTANGGGALFSNTTGYSNTANGVSALYSNTTGFNNTALGTGAGDNVTTGSNLTLIGFDAEPTSASATNQITLGNAAVTSLRCAVTTITALSDARDKKNIQELSLGLEFISKLKPRQFNWDKREWYENNMSDGSKMQKSPTAGFIAQELDEAQTAANAEWLNLVLKDNPEKLEATPGNLLPVMVKAIQELGAKSDELRAENKELKKRLSELEAMVKSLVEQRQDGEKKSIGELR